VIRKPSKDNYTKVKAYGMILQLSCVGMVVKKVVAGQVSEEVKCKGVLSDGQCCNRKGRSPIDAAAIMVNRTHAAWTDGNIPGVLRMDSKAAFPSVAN